MAGHSKPEHATTSPKVAGALVAGAALLLSSAVRRSAATAVSAPAISHVLKMVGAAAATTAPTAPAAAASGGLMAALRGEGMQKSLSFFVMILVGLGLRAKPNFADPKIKRGIKELLMNGLLPCVIFKGLSSIKMSRGVIRFPIISAALIVSQLISGAVFYKVLLPPSQTGSKIPQQTATFINATAAPGLSSFVFINEFGGPGAAGIGSLFDVSQKFYQLIIQPALMRYFSPAAANEVARASGGGGGGYSLGGFVKAIAKDNINIAIVSGLLMSATGTAVTDLGFLGAGINTLASAQTPVLMLLIGLTVKLKGNTPLVSTISLLLRAGVSMLFSGTVNKVMAFNKSTALTLTLFSQAAVSMMGFGILSKVVDGQSKENPAMSKAFAFDIIGYSFPLAIVLNTTACVLNERYVKNLLPMGGCTLGLAAALFLAFKKSVQDKARWTKYLADEKASEKAK
jgi:hypothetical protein